MSSRASTCRPALRVGLVSTSPPRMCGLATFAADVAESLELAGAEVDVVALVDGDEPVADRVRHRLVRSSARSSARVAASLSRDVDVVLIEHEFGIFGGRDGALLGELTRHLTVPYVLTLHTVLGRFTAGQRAALAGPLAGAARVMVFARQAVELLAAQFPDVRDRCDVVPHGAPARLLLDRHVDSGFRSRRGLAATTKVVSTFGLLSPGKGIEHAIRAIALTRPVVGDLVYVVAGRTHPGVVRRTGEAYREHLVGLVTELGLARTVVFEDWFHDIDELATLLHATDVFVTPYNHAEQIVSGALSFAIAAGVPFVSTPYRYAVEMAAAGCGATVPFADPASLSAALTDVLVDDHRRRLMAERAATIGGTMSWPEVGRQTRDVLVDVARAHRPMHALDGERSMAGPR